MLHFAIAVAMVSGFQVCCIRAKCACGQQWLLGEQDCIFCVAESSVLILSVVAVNFALLTGRIEKNTTLAAFWCFCGGSRTVICAVLLTRDVPQ